MADPTSEVSRLDELARQHNWISTDDSIQSLNKAGEGNMNRVSRAKLASGTTLILKDGEAAYRVGDDIIRVGPGHCAHTTWKMHNSPGAPEAFRMLITLLTPVDHELTIRTSRFRA